MEEPEFKPRPDQVDFSHARWAPVMNCVVRYNEKILLVQRNPTMRFYPGYWNGISGFLDDNRSLEEKVRDELQEELGIGAGNITAIHLGPIFDQDEPEYKKTWVVHPVLVEVKMDTITLDWEAEKYAWVTLAEAKTYKLLPGFDRVLTGLFVP